jgi:outer membrane protein assembly factor BamA
MTKLYVYKSILVLLLAGICTPLICRAESAPRTSLTVEDVRCKGNVSTSCSFIRGFVHLAAGEPLAEDEIQNATLRLSSLPDFISVHIYLDKGTTKGMVFVVVEVVEADRVENEFSAGTESRLSSLYQTLEGRIAERGAFGTEDTVNLDVEGIIPIDGPTHHGVYARLQFVDPTLLDSSRYFLISGISYQNTVISYPYFAFDQTDQLSIDLSVGRRLFDYSYVTVGYLGRLISQSVSQSEGSGGLFSTDKDPNNNRGWSLGFGWNSEDDPYFPTRGSSLNSSFGLSWASVRFRKTWSVSPASTWVVQLGGTPGTQYRASLNDSQDFSVAYQHGISARDGFGGINRGRWYIEPGFSYYGRLAYGSQLGEWGVKVGIRLDTKVLGLVDLYVIASTSEQVK